MGRNLKVQPMQVLDELRSGKTTKAELAEKFDVCTATIGSRLKSLRDRQEPVFFDQEGLFLLETIEDMADVTAITKYREWVTKTLIGVLKCSKPIKPLQIQARETFKELTTPSERREFKEFIIKMERMIDYLEVEEDD